MTAEKQLLPLDEAVLLLHVLAARIFEQHNIRILFIKGPVAAMQGLRPRKTSVDVDALCEPEKFDAACRILEEIGWQRAPGFSQNSLAIGMYETTYQVPGWPCTFDLHNRFPGLLAPSREVFDVLWKSRIDLAIAHQRVWTPSARDHFLILCVNALRELPLQCDFQPIYGQLSHAWKELDHAARGDLNAAAYTLGATETARPVLEHFGVTVELRDRRYPKEYRQWMTSRQNPQDTGAVWLSRLFVARWPDRPRLIFSALWDVSLESNRSPEEWASQTGKTRTLARIRRWKRGGGRLIKALGKKSFGRQYMGPCFLTTKSMDSTYRGLPGISPILYAVTIPETAQSFLKGQLSFLAQRGWQPHLVCSGKGALDEFCADEGAVPHYVEMDRRVRVFADLQALRQMSAVMKEVRPAVLVAGTPKAALLGLLAARLHSVPRRVYLVHGLRYEGARGIGRRFLIAIERVTAASATEVVAVSASVKEELEKSKIITRRSIFVLGRGSANGVDTQLFHPPCPKQKGEARAKLNLSLDNTSIILFVGRLTKDKGLHDLVTMSAQLNTAQHLVIVGAPEPTDASDAQAIAQLAATEQVHIYPFTDTIEVFYHAADVLVLPTKREGLPTVVLEAAACGIPCVSYEVTGTVDAIRHDETGLLVPPKRAHELLQRVKELLEDAPQRERLGRQARDFVLENYTRQQVWNSWAKHLAPPELSSIRQHSDS